MKNVQHILKALWEDFTTKRVMNAASMLTYSTLLAIVPVAAVIFAIARGFGYSKYIETWFRNTFESQPQAVEAIIGFVNSYLVHTKSGIVFGIGLLFMLWTVMMLTRGIEQVFNDIWNVRQQRSILRSITDYFAIFLLLPILIIVTSGVTLWMTSISNMVEENVVIGPIMKLTIDAVPFLLLVGIVTTIYIFMPNTKVEWKNAVVPALIASIAIELLQYFYIHSQIWVSSYNAIYGSFAAVPLFMLWLQFSWTIILFGAELSYTEQNLEDFRIINTDSQLSVRHRLLLSAILMSKICKRFNDGKKAYTISELKFETKLPMRIVNELVFDLIETKLLTQTTTEGKNEHLLTPAESTENITMGVLISRLESQHPWPIDTDIEIKESMESPKWHRTLLMHKNYLRAQRDIKLYEL